MKHSYREQVISRRRHLMLGVATLLSTVALPAFAQEAPAPSDKIEEVMVTAEKRTTDIQETPVAVTAITADTFKELSINSFRDVGPAVPGLITTRAGANPTTQTLTMRGFGETDPLADPDVTVYVDDFYLPRQAGIAEINTNTVERVEVLKGPQGTLWGRNSDGGAMRFITKDPTDTFEANVDAGGGDYGDMETHAYMGGPIVEGKVDANLSYAHEQHDGYVHDPVINRDIDDRDFDTFRTKILIKPADDWNIMLTGDGTEDRSDGTVWIPRSPSTAATPAIFNATGVKRTGYNPDVAYNDQIPRETFDNLGVSGRLTYNINDALTMKLISTVRSYNVDPSVAETENDGVPFKSMTISTTHETDMTDELQISGNYDKVQFTGGLFYLHEDLGSGSETYTNVILGSAPIYIAYDLKTDSYAAYGQGTYHFTDKFSGILGLRYSIDQRTYYEYRRFDSVNLNTGAVTPGPAPSANVAGSATQFINPGTVSTWEAMTPKYGVEYQWTPDLMTYASIASGYKSGGFDETATTLAASETPFSPAKLTAYEVGSKSEWFDHHFRANFAAYYNNNRNQQTNIVDPITLLTTRKNVGSSHTKGFELETTAVPFKGFTWNNSASYTFGIYDYFPNAHPGIADTGNRIAKTPHWQLVTGPTYELPDMGIPGTIRLGGTATYTTELWSNADQSPSNKTPPDTFVTAFVNYTTDDGHWMISGTLRNATNNRELQNSISAGATNVELPAPPRTFFVKAEYFY
jgi:iron complex outermembrane receptor protein